MRRHIFRTTVMALALFGVFQLVRPARTNPPADRTRTLQASVVAPHPAVAVFERSCQTCHSNDTRWPWYSEVAPISWVIAHDVRTGRAALNFSEWSAYSHEQQRGILKAACSEALEREMPLRSYALVHPGVTLTKHDIRAICDLASVYSAEVPQEAEPASTN